LAVLVLVLVVMVLAKVPAAVVATAVLLIHVPQALLLLRLRLYFLSHLSQPAQSPLRHRCKQREAEDRGTLCMIAAAR
jgi:hypothetical protein